MKNLQDKKLCISIYPYSHLSIFYQLFDLEVLHLLKSLVLFMLESSFKYNVLKSEFHRFFIKPKKV